jgi:ABC-2 type transport system permease protein
MSGDPRHQGFSWRRVHALALRHFYVLRRSPIRMIELFYWPFMNMIMWGFITIYLRNSQFGLAKAAGIFLGAVILWEVLQRSHLGVMLSFIEELYARNLGHLFVSPLRPFEMIAACMVVSLLRAAVGIIPSALLMAPLFGYSVLGMGLPFAAFYGLLSMFGFAFGTGVVAILVRWGLQAESFAWAALFVFMPVAGVYYPISALPGWLQPISWALPTAYVFEGMRALVIDGVVRFDYMAVALGLNTLIFAGAFLLFLRMFHAARVRGLLFTGGQ